MSLQEVHNFLAHKIASSGHFQYSGGFNRRKVINRNSDVLMVQNCTVFVNYLLCRMT
ncbi:MAG: hypothetical protein LBP87_08890 [Planctomycetaceae bacterium]|nr:hypothetical protein [Planctomycetaceae bacterium]